MLGSSHFPNLPIKAEYIICSKFKEFLIIKPKVVEFYLIFDLKSLNDFIKSMLIITIINFIIFILLTNYEKIKEEKP